MITYAAVKARKKWLSFIKSEKHVTIATFLRRLKVIRDSLSMDFLNECYVVYHEHRRREIHHRYEDDKPYYDRKMSIKPTKARR